MTPLNLDLKKLRGLGQFKRAAQTVGGALFSVMLLILMVMPSDAEAQTVSVEPPTSFTAQSKLLGRKIDLAVDIDIPNKSTRSPAVVLLHGCGGLSPSLAPMKWREFFRTKGYVTLIVESFQARGWGSNVCTKEKEVGVFGQLDRIADAFEAANMLSKLASVDPAKIFLMGFSHGAGTALLSATDSAKAYFANTPYDIGKPPYAGVIANYPWCGREDTYPTATMKRPIWLPTLVLIGDKDNYTPVEYCQAMAAKPAFANSKVFSIQVLKAAQHGFDNGLNETSFKACGGRGQAPTCQETVTIGHSESAFFSAQEHALTFISNYSR
jgi:dienelactone hydrolase